MMVPARLGAAEIGARFAAHRPLFVARHALTLSRHFFVENLSWRIERKNGKRAASEATPLSFFVRRSAFRRMRTGRLRRAQESGGTLTAAASRDSWTMRKQLTVLRRGRIPSVGIARGAREHRRRVGFANLAQSPRKAGEAFFCCLNCLHRKESVHRATPS